MKQLSFIFLTFLATAAIQAETSTEPQALVREAAGRLNDALGYVAQSIVAVGGEYGQWLEQKHPKSKRTQSSGWEIGHRKEQVIEYVHSSLKAGLHPAYQSPMASYYQYLSTDRTTDAQYQLAAFQDLTPVFRAAYNSFNFSWVYLTTKDGMMLIYPYLPISEAVNNDPPTEQIFYTVAQNLKPGEIAWTLPYLDLVGAGLMVTVSTPVYHGDELAAVASRDITLKQLTQSVLKNLVAGGDGVALIVDSSGLAIDVSDNAMEQELQSVNTEEKAAALHYLPPTELHKQEKSGAVASRFAWANQSVALLQNEPGTAFIEVDGWNIYSASISHPQWRLILAYPTHSP